MRSHIINFFKWIGTGIVFTFKLLLALLNYAVISFFKMLGTFFNKIRFSIAFKINLVYAFLYLLLFTLTYGISFALLLNHSSDHLLENNKLIIYFGWIAGISIFVSITLFLIFGRMVVKKMLEPLTLMTKKVKSIKEDGIKERLSTNGAKDELKDLAITFNQMMNRLEVFVERQKQFVSDASHELRTPIAVIEGYADLLDRWGKDDPKILEESIESIKSETKNMKQLVEQLLFLARSDRNTLKIAKEVLNLSDIIKQVAKETSFIDDEHELICKADEEVLILGDSHLIKELIRILVDNAIKYTPESGSITLYSVNTSKNVLLSVKDTGIGIANEHLPHLFERFYKAEESRDKHSGGTGLGLAIAKWIADIHDASITINSAVGEGSEFIIFFPLQTSGK
ncbi:sensor histidine kinase [Cellulosilyticum sp. I15G10I2]|uniref:sensor histidine kinase n=1 Tax=Cellulosilyticum sp. I15G10I2 TaxID=1892843 RepID=UPI00085C862A|nr:HAMP domain-containing sensor histidine kinase [Cellulosilyticum sp. I15G10I2]